MKVCLVVPCFNEEKRLNQIQFLSLVNQRPEIDILFVNDGSRDRTLEVLKELNLSQSQLKYLNLEKNMGKASAVSKGMQHCASLNYDWIGFWDADLATPLFELDRFLEVLNKDHKFKVVIGSRVKRLGTHIKRNLMRHYLGRVFATIAGLMLKIPVYDTQCGAKVFHKSILTIFNEPFVSKWFFDVELLFRIKNLNREKEVFELPLVFWEDVKGSQVKLIDFFKVPIELLKIYRHYK